jgi:gamma-glutamylcyclotransferase (GGCT)/AIG2-like uncharacterized protein YtfP
MHLFVYGTLRRGHAHPMHASLSSAASFVGEARVRGRLYLVAHYPGLVLDDASSWVLGELYHLRDPSVLPLLDDFEGVGPDHPEPREYRRVERTVELLSGGGCSAWVYEYARPTEERLRIHSGDFLSPGRSAARS